MINMNRQINESNKLVYIPAVLPSKDLYERNLTQDFFPHFWNKEKSVWYYPNMLISAYHAYNIENIRKDMNIDDDVQILYDSGGYQAVTLGENIDPKKVIDLQNKNANFGLILDRPPYEFGGSAQFSGTPSKEFFNDCLNKTINNSKIALQYKDSNLKLYGVIQGETWEQINIWYDKMHNLELECNKEFDRWALSPKPSYDCNKIALFGILAIEKKINKPLHILQVSSMTGIMMSAYIRFLTKQLITIDSSSYSSTSRYGRIYNKDLDSFDIGTKNNPVNLDSWFCDCDICKKTNISLKKLTGEKLYNFMDIHNLYHIVNNVKYIDFLVEFDFDLFLKKSKEVSNDCYNAIMMMKYYNENGIDKTMFKYKDIFINKNISSNQISLFKF